MSDESKTAALEQDLAAKAEYASELSGEVERQKKEIGELRKQAEKLEESEAANKVLKGALDAAQTEIKNLGKALDKANAAAEAGEQAIAAGKEVVDGLRKLGAL